LSKKGTFTFSFLATPAGARGTATFGKLGKKSFTVPASGRRKLVVKLKKADLLRVRRKRTAKVTVKVVIAGKPFKATLTITTRSARRGAG
jgi:hypothetical protein